MVKHQVTSWWQRWYEESWPGIIKRSKWHDTKPNLKVGDLVWVGDVGAIRGDYKIGLVEALHPDSRGCVRNVTIRMASAASVASKAASMRIPKTAADLERIKSTKDDGEVLERHVASLVLLVPAEDKS